MLYTYDKNSLKILWSYLTNHWLRTKIDTDFIAWTEIIKGVPQESVLRSTVFSTFLKDLYFFLKKHL